MGSAIGIYYGIPTAFPIGQLLLPYPVSCSLVVHSFEGSLSRSLFTRLIVLRPNQLPDSGESDVVDYLPDFPRLFRIEHVV